MNNKLKLFYIFIIVVLLGCIVHLTREMDAMNVRFIEQNEIANQHISRNQMMNIAVLQQNQLLSWSQHEINKTAQEFTEALKSDLNNVRNHYFAARSKNEELKHDIDSMLDAMTNCVKCNTLKKSLDSPATNP